MRRVVLDSCGWLAYFADEPHADRFAPYIEGAEPLIVPAIVEFEVHRWALRELGDERALAFAAAMSRHDSVGVDAGLARRAAELAHAHRLAACDALVYAVAEAVGGLLVTSDPDLQGLPLVEFHPKPERDVTSRKAKRGTSRRGE